MEHRAYRKTWVLRSIHSIQNNFIGYSYTDFLDKTQIVYVIIFGIFYRNKTSHMYFYTFLTMTNKINYSVHFSPNNFWGKWQRFKYYRCCLGGSRLDVFICLKKPACQGCFFTLNNLILTFSRWGNKQIVSQISKLNSARQWLTWSKSIDKAGPLYDLFRWWFCTKKIRSDGCIVMNFPLQAYLSFLCL